MKVLILDDEEDIRELMSFFLMKMGMTAVEAKNGTEGYAVFIKEKPDLILTDINMPGGDNGWTFLERLQGLGEELPPIVLMSGYEKNIEKLDSINHPVEYLEKPFSYEKVVSAIKKVTGI